MKIKRILDCNASDFVNFNSNDLLNSIKASEGRTICSENICIYTGVTPYSNAEVAKAFGADLILLNLFDFENPYIYGIGDGNDIIKKQKQLCGRPVGINLEPVDENESMLENRINIPSGRICSKKNLELAKEMDADYICLTGNPGTGVSNKEIVKAIKDAKQYFGRLIIAGKMHGAGVNESVADIDSIKEFIEAGADIILVPSVGTIPGFTDEIQREIIAYCHKNGKLVMSAIGTSQETSTKSVIEKIAIRNKINGVDIQHIGDAGAGGIATPENIYTMSVAIRGLRHTINAMSKSPLR